MIQLKVAQRETSQQASVLRKQNLVPGIVYSKGEVGIALIMPALAFDKVYHEAGESSLVDLMFEDGSTKKVLIHEVQTDPVRGATLHVDFYEVDLNKKVTTNVELEFTGEAPIVKSSGGIVIKHLNEIEIECLPTDLIKKFKVDISVLDDFSSAIHVGDLKISEDITILNDPTDVVVNVAEPRVEVEETPVAPAEGEANAEAATDKKEAEGESEKKE